MISSTTQSIVRNTARFIVLRTSPFRGEEMWCIVEVYISLLPVITIIIRCVVMCDYV